MPFKSKKQRAWMWRFLPNMARQWEKKTKNIKNLPDKVKKKKSSLNKDLSDIANIFYKQAQKSVKDWIENNKSNFDVEQQLKNLEKEDPEKFEKIMKLIIKRLNDKMLKDKI